VEGVEVKVLAEDLLPAELHLRLRLLLDVGLEGREVEDRRKLVRERRGWTCRCVR
jgi:hypothetical protein